VVAQLSATNAFALNRRAARGQLAYNIALGNSIMRLVSPGSSHRSLMVFACSFLAILVLIGWFGPAFGQAEAEAAETESSGLSSVPLIEFLFFSLTGLILLAIYFFFVALVVWLLMDLRGGTMMPVEFIETFEEAMNKRRYKEAFEMAKADHSMIGKVMTAGMTRLQHGLQEARDAASAMIESLKARKEHVIAYIAIIGTLGPLIGLVGTVSGMIDSFAELGRGGTPNAAKLAGGISHALNATLVGIFLSCLAIPAFSFFKNRLARITLDATLLTDDLLTQMYHSSRRPSGDAPQAKPSAATAAVPTSTKATEA
jgi:biopolymer transport protein ExbB